MSVRTIRCLPVILICLLASTSFAQDWKVYPHTPEGSLISFPADEGRHPAESIEWWYMAGHLEGQSSGTSYSFMLTYFYYPGDAQGISFDGFRILNLSNDDSGEFHTETMPVRSYRDLAGDHLHLDVLLFNLVEEHWIHREEPAGTLVPFEYEVSASAEHGGLDLSTVLQKRPLIPGDDGLFDQGASSYTYYYSLTSNSVSGSINFDGTIEDVSGSAWIDRQYGSFNPNFKEKYEWFFLQLSNGMDLNIWNLFTPENLLPEHEAYRHLSVYVDENNQYTEHDFSLERLSYTCLPGSGSCYAQQWRLTSELNQLDLVITTLHHNSEVPLPFTFFEGAVSVSGTVNGSSVSGKGFAELLKSYAAPQLSIVSPKKQWNNTIPIVWTVEDPDQGRSLQFDLEYSSDQGATWLPVAVELSDTFYLWNDTPLLQGDSCLFKLSGYSADHTLESFFENPVHTRYEEEYTAVVRDLESSFRIYPNPALNSLKIQWVSGQSDAGDKPYQIIDFQGRLLGSGYVSEGEIDVSMLSGGIYMFILKTDYGSVSQVFIIQ